MTIPELTHLKGGFESYIFRGGTNHEVYYAFYGRESVPATIPVAKGAVGVGQLELYGFGLSGLEVDSFKVHELPDGELKLVGVAGCMNIHLDDFVPFAISGVGDAEAD